MTALPTIANAERISGDAVDRILASAEALFAEHGYAATSMHTIAERAGVSKANVFHHFTSKRELYLAVLNNACRDSALHLQNFETHGPFQRRFTDYADGVLRSMLQHERVHRLILRELLTDDDGQLAKDLGERVFGDRFARLVAILRAGQAAGELRQDFDPAAAAVAFLGANVFFLQARNVLTHFADVRFADDPAQYTRLLADVLMNGISASTKK
jgi:TetR/AcrR family transcriptional regulator